MKRTIALILALIMLLGLTSCLDEPIDPDKGSTTTTTTTTTTTKKPGGTTTTTTTTTGKEDTSEPNLDSFDPDELKTFEELFDPQNHVSIKLDISDEELKKIQKDYEHYSSFGSKSPIYRMADMYVTITKPNGDTMDYVIYQVGVRMKGNTSRTHFWDANSGMYNLIHFKVSFKETFDKEEYYGSDALTWSSEEERDARKDRTFATLEKIDIKWNKNDDPTFIRETYSYDFYRAHGVLVPHTTIASVDIGDDHAGVWTLYEPIDDIFLEKNLAPGALGGDLYKLGWSGEGATFTSFKSYGVEDEDEGKFYIYDLKTNKKKSDHSSLKRLISTLNSSSCTEEDFAAVVDVENFLMFCATSYMIGNPDDLRNNYNNCYIYFRADTGKMIIIPYDMDRGFGVNKDWNPYGDHMTGDSPFQDYNVCGSQRNPLFKKSIQNGGFFVEEYIEALKTVSESEMLDPEYFAERFELAKSLYGDDATPSKRYGNAWDHSFAFDLNKSNSSNMSFKNYITAKQATLNRYLGGSGATDPSDPMPNEGANLYLRGNFYDNNWTNQERYKFTHEGDGVYSVQITASFNSGDVFKFKVYDNDTGAWYNTVDEACSELFVYQGGNRNVQFVEPGSYMIYFDTNTQVITIEKLQ